MRNQSLRWLSFTAPLLCAACFSGPHQLTRSVDDWDRKIYADSPWMDGVLHVIPVIQVASAVAIVGDFFITDAVTFWCHDAWTPYGTGFEHAQISTSKGSMQSLWIEHSSWMRVDHSKK